MDSRKTSLWAKTKVPNLIRYGPSKVYFARVRTAGKLVRKSLKTTVFSVARIRLNDFVKERREAAEARQPLFGKMTFGEAVRLYTQQLENDVGIKESTKAYRARLITCLLKTWPHLSETDIRKISESDCQTWAASYQNKYSPTVFNNTLGSLRAILEISVKAGLRYRNPAQGIKRARVRQKSLHLPEHDRFLELVSIVESAGGRFSRSCGQLVKFLAFGGFRKGEASKIIGKDCDFHRGEIVVRGDSKTGTKNWETRRVPMIPEMRLLLEKLKLRKGKEWDTSPVMEVQECQRALDSACKRLAIARITHHDLRHLFATRCIESGVDIPTVSRWLGHKDGGALAMRVYGHLREEHSSSMAQRVSFSKTSLPSLPEVMRKESA